MLPVGSCPAYGGLSFAPPFLLRLAGSLPLADSPAFFLSARSGLCLPCALQVGILGKVRLHPFVRKGHPNEVYNHLDSRTENDTETIMLRIDRDKQSFSVLDTPTLADVSITERYDLQEFIWNSPEEFFKEIGQDLFLVGKEVPPSENVQDRIDLLAVDKEGSCVVIELKRGNHKLHMLQAISYAGMIAQWEADDVFQLLDEERQEALLDFLEVDRDDVNRQQRIILLAEGYDYALLIGVEWLNEHYGVDITCCRISVAKDASTGSEYIACSVVYPAPELANVSIPRGPKGAKTSKVRWTNWDDAVSSVTNPTVVSHFKQELAANREARLPKRALLYRLAGKRIWSLEARANKAYVWQESRFGGDVEFWQSRLSAPGDVKPVKDGQCLRFFLYTDADFATFHQAATKDMESFEWLEGPPEEEMDDIEDHGENEGN